MPPTLFRKVDYPLSTLLQDIQIGEIGLPDIQRPFVWPNAKVRDLFDSMYRGFPVGYLLFWANGLNDFHKQIGGDNKQKPARLLIVDGQQRLTSLYAVIKGIPVVREDYQTERIYIAFRPLDGHFAVADAAIRKDPSFIPDISLIWSAEADLFELADRYIEAVSTARPVSHEEVRTIRAALSRLKAMENYPFTALELISEVTEEQVAEVFVRINSQGTRLNQADFILTLMSVFWDQGRAQLERFCRAAKTPSVGEPSPFNQFIKPSPDQLLRVEVALGFRRARLSNVYSILRGKDLDTGAFSDERRAAQFGILQQAQQETLNLQHWHEFLKALLQAGFRNGDMISSENGILYSYALFLIGKHDFAVPTKLLRETIAQWFFMVALTSRYTGSFETTVEQDLARLREAKDAEGYVAVMRRIIKDTLTEDFWTITLPNSLAVSSGRSPAVFAYHAALTLLDANVLFSKMKVSDLLNPLMRAHKSALERHHLFPKGYLASIGIREQKDVNQAANFALVEWMDNIEISAKAPHQYLPKHLAPFSESDRATQYFWHALPAGWEHMAYQEFLTERRKRIALVTRAGFQRLLAGDVPEPVLMTVSPQVVPDEEQSEPARDELRHAFWAQLLERAKARTGLFASRKPVKSSSLSAPSGLPYIYYYYSIRADGYSVGVSLYHPDREVNLRDFDAAFVHRQSIETEFGASLGWQGDTGARGAYIFHRVSGSGLLDTADWAETHDSMVDALIRLDKAVHPYLEGSRTSTNVEAHDAG